MPRRQTVLITFEKFPPANIPVDLDDNYNANNDVFNYLVREGLEKEENRGNYTLKKPGGYGMELDKPIKEYIQKYSLFQYTE